MSDNQPTPSVIDSTKVKKKRQRPRTKSIRIELKNKIETALLHKKSPILPLFKSINNTDLSAPLDTILPVLGYKPDNCSIQKLTKHQLRSISNKSRIFKILGADDEPLQVIFDTRNRENLEDKTVYVDNLPLNCSIEQLKRRAGVFGNVVHIHMPVVKRLRRKHCMGPVMNSGFGFVQFSSKTAVRRFCKRYIANCHLNRTHHPKTHRKRKSQLNVSATNPCTSSQNEQQDSSKSNVLNESAPSSQQANDQTSTRRKRRSTEVSISGLDSGTESDFAKPMLKQDDRAIETKEKSKRRRRKRKEPASAFSLTQYLDKIQVFPYSKYKELRKEYIQLKNNNLRTLKEDLKNRDLIHSESDIENIDFASRGDALPPPRKRKRQRSRRLETGQSSSQRRKKHRSRANVAKIATRLKDESFAIPYADNINY